MQWIGVKERVPDDEIDVLVYEGKTTLEGYPKYEVASFRAYRFGSFFVSGPQILRDVTHWAPLPAPPEDE